MSRPFYRLGPPVLIPVSLSSDETPFDMTGKIPYNAKSFMFVNPNPFDVRLEGSQSSDNFKPVTDQAGWLILARTLMGPFTTKSPTRISVKAVSSKAIPIPEDYDFTNCYLEIIYGEGE